MVFWRSGNLSGTMLAVAAILAAAAQPLTAQRFEGVIQQRTITLEDEALQELLNEVMGGVGDEELEGLDETGYARYVARKLFAVPLEQIRAMATSTGSIVEASIHLKGSKMRAEIAEEESPLSYTIVDFATGDVYMVSDAERYYVRWSSDEADKLLAEMGLEPPEAEPEVGAPPEPRETGIRATIGGAQCVAYEVQLEDEVAWGWVTDGHADLLEAIKALSTQLGEIFQEAGEVDIERLLWEKGLPMRTQRLHAGASVYEVEEVIGIERTSVPDEAFALPTGYTQKSLRELWQQD